MTRNQTRSMLVSMFAAGTLVFGTALAQARPNLDTSCGDEKGSETKKPKDPKNPSFADTACGDEKGSDTKKPKDPA